MLGSDLWQGGSTAAPRGSGAGPRGPQQNPSLQPKGPSCKHNGAANEFGGVLDMNSHLLLKNVQPKCTVYPTDRKGCLQKKWAALCVRGGLGGRGLTASESQRQ